MLTTTPYWQDIPKGEIYRTGFESIVVGRYLRKIVIERYAYAVIVLEHRFGGHQN